MRLTFGLLSLALALAACGGRTSAETPAPAPDAPARPLAYLMAQQVVVAPAHAVREGDALGWAAQLPRSRDYLRSIDDAIAAELDARGVKSQWILPPELVRAWRNNPSYAVDPYTLAVNPLRNPNLVAGARIGDPLATQVRTMIALQDRARFVLLPTELRFDRNAAGQGVAVLRLVLLDGRVGEVRWVSDVRSDPSPTFSPGLVTSLAAHLADLITAP